MALNALEQVLSDIIDTKYEAYYQPLFNSYTLEITGFEALARLNDPNEVVSPRKFIAALERRGMISDLDTFIFKSICSFLKKCKDNNVALVPVAINLSKNDFYNDNFIDNLEEIRKSYGIDASLIGVEITSALANEDRRKAISVIDKFHDYGYTVALDNFRDNGQTVSSIDSLDYDIVKLDRSELGTELTERDKEFLSSFMEKLKGRNIVPIALGIETKEQAEFAKQQGCKYVQGYYYEKPMSGKNAYNLLRQKEEALLSSKSQQESYKKKFENLLDQIDAYYWNYVISTKEMYPCSRSIDHFEYPEVVSNYPETIIEMGMIAKEDIEKYRDMYKKIDRGVEHVEEIINLDDDDEPFIIRCNTEFDSNGKPVGAHCSAIRVCDNLSINKKKYRRPLFRFKKH